MCFIAFLALNILCYLLGVIFSLLCLIIPTDTSRAVFRCFICNPLTRLPTLPMNWHLSLLWFQVCQFKGIVDLYYIQHFSNSLRAFRNNCHIHPWVPSVAGLNECLLKNKGPSHHGFKFEILGLVTVGSIQASNLCKPARLEPQAEKNTEAVLDVSLEEAQEEGIVRNWVIQFGGIWGWFKTDWKRSVHPPPSAWGLLKWNYVVVIHQYQRQHIRRGTNDRWATTKKCQYR